MTETFLLSWGGHAWVNMDGLIIDLSFFRTLYSKDFKKPFKEELIKYFGENRRAIIGSKERMEYNNLFYASVECLTGEVSEGLKNGTKFLL